MHHKAKTFQKIDGEMKVVIEDLSTPNEFDEYRNKLGELDKRKYLLLAKEGIRLKYIYPQYAKGIAYALCGLGFTQFNGALDEIAAEFGDLELPDHISTGDWEKVKRLVEKEMRNVDSTIFITP